MINNLDEVEDIVEDYNSNALTNQMYVYFDKVDGVIKVISNEQLEPGEDGMIPMPFTLVEDFLSGKKIPSEHKVIFLNNKQALIVSKAENISSDGGKLFLIPEEPINDQTEVIIEKNYKESCWYFSLSEESKLSVIQGQGTKYKHDFFVVKKFDPNILYRSFSISIFDLVQVERIGYKFESDTEKRDTDVITVRRGFTFYTLVETHE